jgi:predicted HTH transcriptional regulator
MIALGVAIETKDELKPTVAGIILFGSEIALRRLFPLAAKIDYLIVDGKDGCQVLRNVTLNPMNSEKR